MSDDGAARGAIKRARDDDGVGVGEETQPSKRLRQELMLLHELKPSGSWWKRFIDFINSG